MNFIVHCEGKFEQTVIYIARQTAQLIRKQFNFCEIV